MDKYEKFNTNFFNDPSISWYGKMGVLPIDDSKNAEISLTSGITHDQYEGYRVRIVSKEHGEITSNYFAFDSYLTLDPTSRRDHNHGFRIIGHCFDPDGWYIEKPTKDSITSMSNIIHDFIDLYKVSKTKTKSR